MSIDSIAPDTIVLVHGLWMTPRSWEHGSPYYEAKGYEVLAPTYPGLRSKSRRCARIHRVIESRRARDGRAHRGGDHGARQAADNHGPLVRRGADAAPPRPRLRRSRRRDRLGPTEGVHVSRCRRSSRSPRPSSPRLNRHKAVGSRRRSSTTRSPTRERGGVAEVYERYHIPARVTGSGRQASSRTWRPGIRRHR